MLRTVSSEFLKLIFWPSIAVLFLEPTLVWLLMTIFIEKIANTAGSAFIFSKQQGYALYLLQLCGQGCASRYLSFFSITISSYFLVLAIILVLNATLFVRFHFRPSGGFVCSLKSSSLKFADIIKGASDSGLIALAGSLSLVLLLFVPFMSKKSPGIAVSRIVSGAYVEVIVLLPIFGVLALMVVLNVILVVSSSLGSGDYNG